MKKKTVRRLATASSLYLLLLMVVIPAFGLSIGGYDIPPATLQAALAGIVLLIGVGIVAAYWLGHLDNTVAALFGVILVAAVVVFFIFMPYFASLLTEEKVPPVPPTRPIKLTDPLRIRIVDAITKTPQTTGTIEIWKPGGYSAFETLSTFTSGYADTINEYVSGDKLIFVWYDGNGYYSSEVTVPYGQDNADLERGYIPINYEVYAFPTAHAAFIQLPNGTTYSNSESPVTLEDGWTSNLRPTIYFQARITSDNTGFIAYNDPEDEDFPRREVLLILVVTLDSGTGNRPAISGMTRVYTDANRDIYVLRKESLKRVLTSSGRIVEEGTWGTSITVDLNPMTDGDVASLSFRLSYHDNFDYLKSYGASISDAVEGVAFELLVTR